MSPLKFSVRQTAASTISSLSSVAVAPVCPKREPSLDFLSNACGLLLLSQKVIGDVSLVPEAIRDHGVDVRREVPKSTWCRVYSGAGNPDDAVGVGVDWHPFDSFGQIHLKHLSIRLYDPDLPQPGNRPDSRRDLSRRAQRRITFGAVFWSAAAPARRVSTRAEFTVRRSSEPEPGFPSRLRSGCCGLRPGDPRQRLNRPSQFLPGSLHAPFSRR